MISIKPKLNFTLIFLLIITLIGGSYLAVGHIGGVEISAYRFLLGISACYLLLTKQFKCYTNRFSKYVFFIFLVWVLYGLISLLWTPDLIFGIQEIFYLGVGLTSYLVFFSFANSEHNFELVLEKIWIACFVTVIIFLVIEMVTQRHLEGDFLQRLSGLGDFHRTNLIPIFTFINQNILGIYFCISIVFAGYSLLQNRNKILNCIIILVALDFLFLTESRLGILCLVILLIINVFLFLFKNVRKRIGLSFTKKQVLALVLLIGFNAFVIHKEIDFLDVRNEFQFHNDENAGPVYSEICEKINEQTSNNNRILLISDNKPGVKPVCGDDVMFVIEQNAYLKLLDGNNVQLTLKQVGPELHHIIFMGDNQWMIALLMLLTLFLIIAYFVNYRFKTSNALLIAGCVILFLVTLLPVHTFSYSSEKYRSLVLTEPDFDPGNLELNDLGVISTSATTGSLLREGKEVKTYLYSNEMAKADSGLIVPEKLSSNTIRKNLVMNGIEYLKSSHYMGLGSGGFLASNLKKLNKYPDGGVGGAHNFIIEILSQYGVIIFVLLFSVFTWIGVLLFRAFKNKSWNDQHFIVLWLFVTLIFMGNANSSFLSLPINWFLVVFLLIFANKIAAPRKDTNENEH
ncbi:Teichuronic acid biosynthesis protein TuaE [compost metagenome]